LVLIPQGPQEDLHIDGSIRIEDGSENDGFVFTSDSNGTGTWRRAAIGAIRGNLVTGVDIAYKVGSAWL